MFISNIIIKTQCLNTDLFLSFHFLPFSFCPKNTVKKEANNNCTFLRTHAVQPEQPMTLTISMSVFQVRFSYKSLRAKCCHWLRKATSWFFTLSRSKSILLLKEFYLPTHLIAVWTWWQTPMEYKPFTILPVMMNGTAWNNIEWNIMLH